MSISTVASVASVAVYLGKSIVVETIQITSMAIRKLLEENKKLNHLTGPLDLEAELEVIDQIVLSLGILEKSSSPNFKVLEVALKNLKEGVETTHCLLQTIHSKLQYHESLWFSVWRTPAYLDDLISLEICWIKTRGRKDTLLQVTQLVAHSALIFMADKQMTLDNKRMALENQRIDLENQKTGQMNRIGHTNQVNQTIKTFKTSYKNKRQ